MNDVEHCGNEVFVNSDHSSCLLLITGSFLVYLIKSTKFHRDRHLSLVTTIFLTVAPTKKTCPPLPPSTE